MDAKGNTSQPQTQRSCCYTWLVLMASIMPIPFAASLITAAIHISKVPPLLQNFRTPLISVLGPELTTLVAGLVITLIIWLVLAVFVQNMTTMDSANPLSAIHLKNHLSTLQTAFYTLAEPGSGTNSSVSHSTYEENYSIAHKQVKAYVSEINEVIGCSDARWVSAR